MALAVGIIRQNIKVSDRSKWLLRLIDYLFPYFLIGISIAGFTFAYVENGIDSALNSLIYAAPILIAGIIFLARRTNIELVLPTFSSRFRFYNLVLPTIFLFIVTIFVLLLAPTRPLVYFVLVSLISGLIILQIIWERQPWTDYLIILEVVALALNVIWGITLKYPLYFGYTDTLGDLHDIATIVQSGHINGINFDYQNFPLYYVFNAISSEVTGLSLRDSLFIFMGLAWQIGILFVFLILDKLSHSRKLALIACLLFALSSETIFYGSYAIPRALAFVFVLCLLYLILNTKKVKFIFLYLIIMCALILTHHLTVLFVIPVLTLLYICQKVLSKRPTIGISLLPILILFIVFTAYLIYPARSFTAFVLPQRLTEVSSPIEGAAVPGSQRPDLIVLLYYSFALLLTLIGIGFVFKVNKLKNRYIGISGIALASLVFLPLFVSGPTNLIPQAQSLLLYRLPLLVSPFIAIMMAFGLAYLISFEINSKRGVFRPLSFPVLTLGLVIATIFFSMICDSNASDYPFSYPMAAGSQYFTNQELQSFSFMNQRAEPSLATYGDYETSRNEYSLNNLPTRLILTTANINYIKSGYVVLRTGEMKRTGGLSFSPAGSTDQTYRFYTEPSTPKTDIKSNLSIEDNIYSNDDVEIFLVK